MFLFQQSGLDRFLAQFDREWVNVCKAYRKLPNGEDALFRLTPGFNTEPSFVWRGKSYRNLLEMEETWERDEGRRKKMSCPFFKEDMLHFIWKSTKPHPNKSLLQPVCRMWGKFIPLKHAPNYFRH